MSTDNINKMYDAMYDSRRQEFEKAKNKSLADIQATEEKNKNTFYNQRNDVAYNSAKNTQAIRDYMAKNNLLASGESVDALLRNNTDYSNRMGTVDTNESTFRNDLLRQRNLVNSNYENDINSAKSQIEMERARAINEYEERRRQEQLAAQQAAARYSSSGSSKSSIAADKNNMIAEFKDLMSSKNNWKARDFLENGKEQIIADYGYATWSQMNDMYWKDMGSYYSPKR